MEQRAEVLMGIGVNTSLSHRSFHHISATLNLSSVIGDLELSTFGIWGIISFFQLSSKR